MPTIVYDCPRCGARQQTFDVTSHVKRAGYSVADWQKRAEIYAVCRSCGQPSILSIEIDTYDNRQNYTNEAFWKSDLNLNATFKVRGFISLKDSVSRKPPEHIPEPIREVFQEGATCLSVECYNASATMFRLCLDIATRGLLPDPDAENGPNRKQRRDLGLRIPWLIENDLLPRDLADLADVIREDANDGAHVGNLTREDAEDIADFAELLLDRLYTEPARVELARARRVQRRAE